MTSPDPVHGSFAVVALVGLVSLLPSLAWAQDAGRGGRKDEAEEARLAQARLQTAELQAAELQRVIETYYVRNAHMPKTWADLLAKDAKGKSYLNGETAPVDPWGNEYRIVKGKRANAASVVSAGPDGKPGTQDDVSGRKVTPITVLSELHDLEGKPFGRISGDGHMVVLHFWSMHCPYEWQAEPKLAKLAADYGASVTVFAIAANADEIGGEPPAAAFAAADPAKRPYPLLREHVLRVGLTHRVLVDHDGAATRYFGAKATTHCVVIDSKGQVAYAGALDDDPKGLASMGARFVRTALDATRNGHEVVVEKRDAYGTPLRPSGAATTPK